MAIPVTLVNPFVVSNSVTTESQPIVAAGRDGRFAIEWDSNSGATENAFAQILQGANIGAGGAGVIATPSTTSGTASNPDAAFLNSGAHVITFEKVVGGNRDIFARIDLKNGDGTYTIGSEFLVNSTTTTGNQFMPEITVLTGGGFVVAWQDNSDVTIKLQRYNAAGTAIGAVQSVSANGGQTGGSFNHDLIALQNGGYAVIAKGPVNNGDGMINAFDSNGVATVSNLDVSFQSTGASHGALSITQLSNGNIVAMWRDADAGGIGYRVFDSSFAPLTGDLLISETGLGVSAEIPRVAATLDGRFMVVFSGFSSGPVWGQMVNSDGTFDGATFQVSEAGSTTANQPEVETTADGRMIVTWRENGDIYARVYDPRETGIGVGSTAGNDNFVGSAFNDTFSNNTTGGNDTIFAGAGDDFIRAGVGADRIDGGIGRDKVSYLFSTAGIAINLQTGAASGGYAAGDVLTLVEDIFGSAFGDTLIGDNLANILEGHSGNDLLVGGLGQDTLDGGGDTDTVDYSAYATGVSINLGTGIGADGDLLISIENAIGSAFGDVLVGDNGANTIRGGAGNDFLIAGNGADLLIGGADLDTVSYETATGGVLVNLSTGTGANGGVLQQIENITGSAFGDVLQGDNGANTIRGGAGNDFLIAGNGADLLIGGADNDTVSYETATLGIAANLTTGAGANGGVLQEIENLTGSAFGDVLTGNAGSNTIKGGGGNDFIVGGAGSDALFGGADADIFRYDAAGFGNDVIADFQDGLDHLSFATSIASSFSAFTISGNGTNNVSVSIGGQTLAVQGAAAITLSAADFFFS